MLCRFRSHLVAQICGETSVSLEPIRSYPGGGYILWKINKVTERVTQNICTTEAAPGGFTQPTSLPDAPAAPPIPGTQVLPVLPWALGK